MYFPLHGDIWNLPPVATPRLPFIWNVSCYFVCIFNNFNDVKPARKETEQEKNKTIQLDFLGDYFFSTFNFKKSNLPNKNLSNC